MSEVVLDASALMAVLARALGAPAMTADRSWSGLELGLEIRTIR